MKYIFLILFAFSGGNLSAQVVTESKSVAKQILSGSYSYDLEVSINRPASAVWPHLLDFESWFHGVRFVHIPSESNKVRQIWYVFDEAIQKVSGISRMLWF